MTKVLTDRCLCPHCHRDFTVARHLLVSELADIISDMSLLDTVVLQTRLAQKGISMHLGTAMVETYEENVDGQSNPSESFPQKSSTQDHQEQDIQEDE